MIQFTPPAGVIARWQPELDRIAPPTERGFSSLKLIWEPGEVWAPVGRWVIYQMSPVERAPFGIVHDLLGPNPRRYGRYDWAAKKFVRTRSFMVTERQWKLYHETGLFGKPYWVVQGSFGGHKRHWSEIEQQVIAIQTGITEQLDPPAPGDLPYAEPSNRTIRALKRYDMVEKFGDTLKMLSHRDDVRARLDSIEAEQARAMAEELWKWLGEQVAETLTFTRAMVNTIWDNADPDAAVNDYEAEEEDFYTEVAGATAF